MSKLIVLSLLSALSSSAVATQVNLDCKSDSQFCRDEFVQISNGKKDLETVIENIPIHLRRNVTFKRGNNMSKRVVGILGPHGHRVSELDSGSASPEQPRVFIWDEKTGFTASWNSGNKAHTAHDRIDLYDFDFKTMTHRLEAWSPSTGMVDANFKDAKGNTCVTCHGPNQRPIFPMYPDWPHFFGEFNDEMTGYAAGADALRTDLKIMANEFQPKERKLYEAFLNGEAKSNRRYTPIFAVKPKAVRSELVNPLFPYRPRTTTKPFSDVSRAFYFRPNLRLGVLYNRLTALQLFEKIKTNKLFQKHPDAIFYSLLDCNWDAEQKAADGAELREKILGSLLADAHNLGLKSLTLRGAQFADGSYKNSSFQEDGYSQLPYEDLLKILDLKIEDVDIRFQYNAGFKVKAGYGVFDPRAFYHTDNAMDIGYINQKYAMNPICDNNNKACDFSYQQTYMKGMRYFNSYFDGSATTNELLAAQMLLYLTSQVGPSTDSEQVKALRAHLKSKIANPTVYFETLAKKYSRFTKRLELDRPFFQKMDAIGPWIQLPYPPDMVDIQNRESFWTDGATPVRLRHAQWLDAASRQSGKKNLNNGQNICWNIYDYLKLRAAK